MSERAETPSSDLTPREQARILIVAYWRGVGGDAHVGYGTAKGHVWLGLAGQTVCVPPAAYPAVWLFCVCAASRVACPLETVVGALCPRVGVLRP